MFFLYHRFLSLCFLPILTLPLFTLTQPTIELFSPNTPSLFPPHLTFLQESLFLAATCHYRAGKVEQAYHLLHVSTH